MALKTNFLAAVQRTNQELTAIAAPPAAPNDTVETNDEDDKHLGARGGGSALFGNTKKDSTAKPVEDRIKRRLGTTIYLNDEDYMQLKHLALRERRKLNDYLSEAVADYMQKIADKLDTL